MKRRNSWDRFAKDYDKKVSDSGDMYHKNYLNPLIFKLLGDIKNKKILDLACGNGYFSRLLADKHAIVTGVDYSKELISIAKNNTKIKFFVGSAENLSFLKNNSFDFIICNMSFHDIKNISKTIEGCSKLLKKRAKLIFSIPHPVFSLSEFVEEKGKYSRKIIHYMSELTLDHPFYKGLKHYHRPIEYYTKLLFKNKFVISNFYEITTKHDIKGKIEKNVRLLKHKREIPYFLIIEATSIK